MATKKRNKKQCNKKGKSKNTSPLHRPIAKKKINVQPTKQTIQTNQPNQPNQPSEPINQPINLTNNPLCFAYPDKEQHLTISVLGV
jgi:hypothetical protein